MYIVQYSMLQIQCSKFVLNIISAPAPGLKAFRFQRLRLRTTAFHPLEPRQDPRQNKFQLDRTSLKSNFWQGCEFTHRFSERITRFLRKICE